MLCLNLRDAKQSVQMSTMASSGLEGTAVTSTSRSAPSNATAMACAIDDAGFNLFITSGVSQPQYLPEHPWANFRNILKTLQHARWKLASRELIEESSSLPTDLQTCLSQQYAQENSFRDAVMTVFSTAAGGARESPNKKVVRIAKQSDSNGEIHAEILLVAEVYLKILPRNLQDRGLHLTEKAHADVALVHREHGTAGTYHHTVLCILELKMQTNLGNMGDWESAQPSEPVLWRDVVNKSSFGPVAQAAGYTLKTAVPGLRLRGVNGPYVTAVITAPREGQTKRGRTEGDADVQAASEARSCSTPSSAGAVGAVHGKVVGSVVVEVLPATQCFENWELRVVKACPANEVEQLAVCLIHTLTVGLHNCVSLIAGVRPLTMLGNVAGTTLLHSPFMEDSAIHQGELRRVDEAPGLEMFKQFLRTHKFVTDLYGTPGAITTTSIVKVVRNRSMIRSMNNTTELSFVFKELSSSYRGAQQAQENMRQALLISQQAQENMRQVQENMRQVQENMRKDLLISQQSQENMRKDLLISQQALIISQMTQGALSICQQAEESERNEALISQMTQRALSISQQAQEPAKMGSSMELPQVPPGLSSKDQPESPPIRLYKGLGRVLQYAVAGSNGCALMAMRDIGDTEVIDSRLLVANWDQFWEDIVEDVLIPLGEAGIVHADLREGRSNMRYDKQCPCDNGRKEARFILIDLDSLMKFGSVDSTTAYGRFQMACTSKETPDGRIPLHRGGCVWNFLVQQLLIVAFSAATDVGSKQARGAKDILKEGGHSLWRVHDKSLLKDAFDGWVASIVPPSCGESVREMVDKLRQNDPVYQQHTPCPAVEAPDNFAELQSKTVKVQMASDSGEEGAARHPVEVPRTMDLKRSDVGVLKSLFAPRAEESLTPHGPSCTPAHSSPTDT